MNAVIGNPEILRKIVKNVIDFDTQLQMCGVDLTVEKIVEFTNRDIRGTLDFDNTKRVIPTADERPRFRRDLHKLDDWSYFLSPGAYLVHYNEEVNIPENVLGIVFPRSSLMRMGATLQSAVWDPGYNGKGCGLLIVHKNIEIWKNARIGQIIFLTTDAKITYKGIFQNERLEKED